MTIGISALTLGSQSGYRLGSASFATSLLLGMNVVYLISLVLGSSAGALLVVVLSFFGLCIIYRRRGRLDASLLKSEKVRLFFIFGIYLILVLVSSLTILEGWDGRSIWAFKAKILFFGGGFGTFKSKGLAFMHPDYPLLIPVLETLFAKFLGYWNEYLPKLSMILFFITFLFWVASNTRSFWDFLVKSLFTLFFFGEFLWNSYADAPLVILSLVGVVSLQQHLKSRRTDDYVLGWLSLLTAMSIKTEGLFVVGTAALILILRRRFEWNIRKTLLILFALVPLLYWKAVCKVFHFTNYYSDSFSFIKGWERIRSLETYHLLFHDFFLNRSFLSALFALAVGIMLTLVKSGPRVTLARLQNHIFLHAVSTLYLMVLMLVLIFTPLDFWYHVRSSASRLVLFEAVAVLWVALDLFTDFSTPIRGIEKPQRFC